LKAAAWIGGGPRSFEELESVFFGNRSDANEAGVWAKGAKEFSKVIRYEPGLHLFGKWN
jgi:hypothetical protein